LQLHYEFGEEADEKATKQRRQIRMCLRRVVLMMLMVLSFLIFW
jgi:hypothetical protein